MPCHTASFGGISIFSEIDSIIPGRKGIVFFELFGKLALVAKSNGFNDLRNIHICGFQKPFRGFQPTDADITGGRLAGFFLEIPDEMGGIQVELRRQIIHGQGLI